MKHGEVEKEASGKVTIHFRGDVTFRMADLWRFKEMTPDEVRDWVFNEWPTTADPFSGASELVVWPNSVEAHL